MFDYVCLNIDHQSIEDTAPVYCWIVGGWLCCGDSLIPLLSREALLMDTFTAFSESWLRLAVGVVV